MESRLGQRAVCCGRATLVSLALLVPTVFVRADSWGFHKTEHWSENGQYCLFVEGKVFRRPTLILKHKVAAGLQKVWTIASPQKAPPVRAHVSGEGDYVVLEDEHGGLGRGIILAFLGPTGKALSAFRLEDLFTDEEILGFLHSVSSTWWSLGSVSFLRASARQFVVLHENGTAYAFDLGTGRRIPETKALVQRIREERLPGARRALGGEDQHAKYRAVVELALLDDRESVPDLIRLLNDPHFETEDRTENDEQPSGSYRVFSLRKQTRAALVRILGTDAIPHLARALASKDPDEVDSAAYEIAKAGGPRARAALIAHARSTGKPLPGHSVLKLVEKDRGAFARSYPMILLDRREDVRFWAFRSIAEHPKPTDTRFLATKLRSKDESIVLWALRGLRTLKTPGMEQILKGLASRRKDTAFRFEAESWLAELGDRRTLAKKVAALRPLELHRAKNHWAGKTACYLPEDEVALSALLQWKPAGLREALIKASKSDCPTVRILALGGRACLGDPVGLPYLRRMATIRPPSLDYHKRFMFAILRADAIRWLGSARDRGSLELVRPALRDEDREVREAAKTALARLSA